MDVLVRRLELQLRESDMRNLSREKLHALFALRGALTAIDVAASNLHKCVKSSLNDEQDLALMEALREGDSLAASRFDWEIMLEHWFLHALDLQQRSGRMLRSLESMQDIIEIDVRSL